MANSQTEDLVGQLTNRLEQLQNEKTELERAVQEQGDGLALKLRLALLAYEQQNPPRHHHHHRKRSKSRSTVSSSPSSSLSTSASTSSSASFPASPGTQISPVLPGPPPDPEVLSALRENESLRVRLANSERVNAYYQRELAELRKRCGISIDELEELDLSGNEGVVGASSGLPGGSTSRRRQRTTSRSDMPSIGTSSIRIPGASSVSPPAARLSTSSFPFSTSINSTTNARYQPQSYTSYVSSVNTTLTTPSSSYPVNRAPAPTPATSNAFSPVSGPGPRSAGAINGSHGRRNSLSALVAAALAHVQEAQEAGEASDAPPSAGSAASGSFGGAASRGGIDLEDLLHISSSSPSASSSTLDRSNAGPPSSSFSALGHPAPFSSASAASSLSSSSLLSHSSSSSSNPTTATDPLVAAITRSLAKLASADSLGQARTSRRLDVEYVDADEAEGEFSGSGSAEGEEGSGSSSTTSREGQAGNGPSESMTVGGSGSARVAALRRAGTAADEDADEEDGGETPLSVSPGSRSGSLSRRVSTRSRISGKGR